MSIKTNLNTSIAIYDIIEINEINSKLVVEFGMTILWNDQRLNFNFLKNDYQKNIMSKDVHFWVPGIIFLNTMTKKEDILVYDSITRVVKMENGTINEKEQVEMNVFFDGDKNIINKTTKYIMEFI